MWSMSRSVRSAPVSTASDQSRTPIRPLPSSGWAINRVTITARKDYFRKNGVQFTDYNVAENMAKAAKMLSEAPGALHLRTLQSLNDLSSDQSNTVIFAVPLEILRAFERFAQSKKCQRLETQ